MTEKRPRQYAAEIQAMPTRDDRLKALETASLSLEATVRANTEILAQHDMTGQLTLWVLQMTCINEADTAEKREKCLSRPSHGDGR